MRVFDFVAVSLAVVACSSSSRTVTEPVVYSQAEAADSVRIRVNETIITDGIRIRFTAVESDSRCPMDVVCVWEGDAVAAFAVSPDFEAASALDQIKLHTTLEPRSAVAQGHRIELLALIPYPRASSQTKPSDYAAWIRVVRDG